MAPSIQRSLTLRPLTKAQCFTRPAGGIRSASAIAKDFPPESPDYVDVPQPLQPQIPKKPIIKGVLPTPKRLFKPYGAGPWRTSEEYMNKTVADSQRTRAAEPTGKDAEFVAYKDRMRDMRKESLKTGLKQLKSRHDRTMRAIEHKSQAKQRINHENIVRPERDDERLTSTTIIPLIENMVSAPMTEEQIAEKRARYEAKEWAKSTERKGNLHTLYLNARDFIVTEDQLNAKINEVFDDPFWQNENDPSIWAKEGKPERLQDILTRQSGGSLSTNENFTLITKQRLHAISEELTGGKMEEQARIDKRAQRKRI